MWRVLFLSERDATRSIEEGCLVGLNPVRSIGCLTRSSRSRGGGMFPSAVQCVMVTGVPTWTFEKMIGWIVSGTRMQPWLAGYPGTSPMCMPMPPVTRIQ